MKLLSYIGTRPGIAAIGSYLIRRGVKSVYSHTEVLFEPGDGCAHLMPDGSLEPDETGALWCASSTAGDTIPKWSPKRAGGLGGVRFKRIVLKPENWVIQELPTSLFDPTYAAKWFVLNQGLAYDYRHILSFVSIPLNMIIGQGIDCYTCTESCAASLGYSEPERFHPGNLPIVISRINHLA